MCFFSLFALLITDKIMATLGEGTFGRVVKVKDMQMYVNSDFHGFIATKALNLTN